MGVSVKKEKKNNNRKGCIWESGLKKRGRKKIEKNDEDQTQQKVNNS